LIAAYRHGWDIEKKRNIGKRRKWKKVKTKTTFRLAQPSCAENHAKRQNEGNEENIEAHTHSRAVRHAISMISHALQPLKKTHDEM
jgi:hypothetical protein